MFATFDNILPFKVNSTKFSHDHSRVTFYYIYLEKQLRDMVFASISLLKV